MATTAQTSVKTAVPKRRLSERKRDNLFAYLFISPFFIIFGIFGLYPILFTIYLSFFKWDALNPMVWVGLQNFQFVLEDSIFWTSFTNTLLLSVMGTIPQLFIAFLM